MRGSWLQRSNKSKVLTSFKGSRASGFSLRVSWLQRSNMSKFLENFKDSRTPGIKSCRGSRIDYEAQGFLEGHSKSLASKVSNPGASELQGSKVSRHVETYP